MSQKRAGTDSAAGRTSALAVTTSPPTPEVVSRRVLHKGRKFDFELVDVKRPDGSILQRELVRHPGAVVVVAIRKDGGVVLIRNFRISVEQRLLECCAGTLEPGEDPAVCAGRELVEETGYRAGRVEPLGWFFTTPGLTDEKMYAFVATDLTHVGQDLEDDETIEVAIVPAGEVIQLVERGDIRDGKTIAALLLAERKGRLAVSGQWGGH